MTQIIGVTYVSVSEAKNNFSRYSNRAHNGERIIVTKNGEPCCEITAVTKKERNPTAINKGQPAVSDVEADLDAR